jgi:Ca2+/Na+ antiporter
VFFILKENVVVFKNKLRYFLLGIFLIFLLAIILFFLLKLEKQVFIPLTEECFSKQKKIFLF